MKRIFLIGICLVLLSGCIEQQEDKDGSAEKRSDKVFVTISSPGDGQILKGDKEVLFEASAEGGKGPYTYRWSSNLNEEPSTKASFRQSPSDLAKRRHMIILAAKDANCLSGQGSDKCDAMQKCWWQQPSRTREEGRRAASFSFSSRAKISRVGPSRRIPPSFITTARVAYSAAISMEWVMMMIVWPRR